MLTRVTANSRAKVISPALSDANRIWRWTRLPTRSLPWAITGDRAKFADPAQASVNLQPLAEQSAVEGVAAVRRTCVALLKLASNHVTSTWASAWERGSAGMTPSWDRILLCRRRGRSSFWRRSVAHCSAWVEIKSPHILRPFVPSGPDCTESSPGGVWMTP